jgi:GAF domain-containing protein
VSEARQLSTRRRYAYGLKTLLALSLLKVALALAALAITVHPVSGARSHIPDRYIALQLASFAGAGCILVLGHGRDQRTARLGLVLVVIASAFAAGKVSDLSQVIPIGLLARAYPDAFLPLAISLFITTFPDRLATARSTHALHLMTKVAAGAGVVLFGANVINLPPITRMLPLVSSLERRSAGGNVYWAIVFGLLLVIVPLAFVGTTLSTAAPVERRRSRLFWGAFVAGLAPTLLVVVGGFVPRIGQRITAWAQTSSGQALLQLSLTVIPIAVAYAVLVRQLLPLRVALRRVMHTLLTRWVVTLGTLMAVVLLVADLYARRTETVISIFIGREIWLLGAVVIGALTLSALDDIRRTLDSWFFPAASRARRSLIDLSNRIREARSLDELVAWLTAGISQSLQPEALAVLIREPANGNFVSLFGKVEPLPASAILSAVLSRTTQPIDVRLDQPQSPVRWLPTTERQWLVDSRSRLLVPLRGADQSTVGVITMSDRADALPFSDEERWLLMALADAAALLIENRAMRAAIGHVEDQQTWQVGVSQGRVPALECPECGLVYDQEFRTCDLCQSPLTECDIPLVLFGKFRLECRAGHGAMGIVYKARDLDLEREVAIKTLPGTSPEGAERLRSEAKHMATVTHRHLAMIFSVESWRGRPLLVYEYMNHGTLASRLERGRLTVAEALSLGIALAEALQVIHQAGLLHRDLKPSNIGFSQQWVPKILDFGLVHLLEDSRIQNMESAEELEKSLHQTDAARRTTVVGTPLYLSPESSLGDPPSVSFDLWSLNVLLLESIVGFHPFRGSSVKETLDRIRRGATPEMLDSLHQHPSVALYFKNALARDVGSRPRTAGAVRESLRTMASGLRLS